MHSNENFDKNTAKYRKFVVEETQDKLKPKRNKFKDKRVNKRDDPVLRFRNGYESE